MLNYHEAIDYLAKLGVPDEYRHQCTKHIRGDEYDIDDLESVADWCLDSLEEEGE